VSSGAVRRPTTTVSAGERMRAHDPGRWASALHPLPADDTGPFGDRALTRG